jgi:ribosome recycling factor
VHNDLREFEREKMISEDDLARGEDRLQKLTDHQVEAVTAVGQRKEAEILEV